MSGYKGFITLNKCIELCDLLCKLADTRGLENKLHHLYQPDTDMNDKICENFEYSKTCIIRDLMEMSNDVLLLAIEVLKLKER